MVETWLLLQHSDIIPVHRVVVTPCMLGQYWVGTVSGLHSFPVLLHSFAQAPTCLNGGATIAHGTWYTTPASSFVGMQSFGLTIVTVWGWCLSGRRPSLLVEQGLVTLPQTNHERKWWWQPGPVLVICGSWSSWCSKLLKYSSRVPVVDRACLVCQVSWSLVVTSEQIAPALLCNVLTTASLWASGWWELESR